MTTKNKTVGTAPKVNQPTNDAKTNQMPVGCDFSGMDPEPDEQSKNGFMEESAKKWTKLVDYYIEKSEKIKQLTKVENRIQHLADFADTNRVMSSPLDMFEESEANFTLVLSSEKVGYKRAEIFQLNNPEMIDEIMSMIIYRLKAKAEVLKHEIAQ